MKSALSGPSLCLYVLISRTGFALSFGVSRSYYSEHEPCCAYKTMPLIYTLATGVVYLPQCPSEDASDENMAPVSYIVDYGQAGLCFYRVP